MEEQQVDLSLVSSLEAEVFGEPGQRTFRLVVRTEHGGVSLWLEKEQVTVLNAAVLELLERIPESSELTGNPPAPSPFEGDLEVRVGSLALGFDSRSGAVSFRASDLESHFNIVGVSFLARREHLEHLQAKLAEILAGSRPRCTLCGTVLTGLAHFCPQSNGHAKVTNLE